MGKLSGFFWPGLLGIRHMPRFSHSDYYDAPGVFREVKTDDMVGYYLQHPIWEGNSEFFVKNASRKEVYAISAMTMEGYCGLLGQNAQVVADGMNYLIVQKREGRVHFVDQLYSSQEIAEDPDKAKTKGILFQGEPGKPMAIVIAGGGFVGVGSYSEAIPVAMELHQKGYSAFVLIYRVNRELHKRTRLEMGNEAAKDILPAVRFLLAHQQEYQYTMDGFSIFGFSAGGLITTAYAFADYPNCCHNHDLPRPAAIFPIYGLHWDLKLHEQDQGLAVFSRFGRDDTTGFAAGERLIPLLRQQLGDENVDIVVYDKIGHGFGLGYGTTAEGWLCQAVGFWERHRRLNSQ